MTVDQVIDTLKLEKQQRVPSRFPCRAIMVGNIAEYCDLLEKLKTIPNVEVVPSDVLFSSADVLPAYDSLMDSQYKDKWLILPGVSEYLRLFSRGETQRQRLQSSGVIWDMALISVELSFLSGDVVPSGMIKIFTSMVMSGRKTFSLTVLPTYPTHKP